MFQKRICRHPIKNKSCPPQFFTTPPTPANYQFTRILGGYVNGFYRYSDAVDSTDGDTGEKVHRYRAGAGFVMEPLRWMEIRLGYTFNKVNSDNEFDEYDEHRGLLKITLTPSQPYRLKD